MTYSELFADHGGNILPVLRGLAKGMDEQEMHLERVRVALGFQEDWSPVHDRRQRSGVSAPIRWVDKAAAMNGRGDMHTLVGEICEWLDMMAEKRAEVDAALAPVADDPDAMGVRLDAPRKGGWPKGKPRRAA